MVRTQALNSIGKLYNLAYPEIENNDPAAIQRFAWIPDEIVQATSANLEIRPLIEQVLAEYVIPLPSITTSSATKEKDVDEVAWADRILIVMRNLSETSKQLLIGLSGLKSSYVPGSMSHIILTLV
jgi:sister-chromatid-cohesion protein PDS5